MTQTEPTLAAPLRPSTVDFGAILAAHAERTARTLALRPCNKDRLFDGLMARRHHPCHRDLRRGR